MCYAVPMKQIELSGKRGKGHYTIVDDSTFTKYGHLAWHLSDTGYAVRRNREGTLRLHRLVAEVPEDKVVDHLNGSKLDNRKSNLRICTQKENSQNRKGTKGYAWDRAKGKWIVRYRNTFYGRYANEAEAKRAYQLASSGVPYKKKERKQYMLPKNVHKQFGKYNISLQRNGTRLRKNGIPTLAEAIKQLNEWKKEG